MKVINITQWNGQNTIVCLGGDKIEQKPNDPWNGVCNGSAIGPIDAIEVECCKCLKKEKWYDVGSYGLKPKIGDDIGPSKQCEDCNKEDEFKSYSDLLVGKTIDKIEIDDKEIKLFVDGKIVDLFTEQYYEDY